MKKNSLVILLSLFLTFPTLGQSIHNLSFTNIDGANVSLNTYAGKKVLFIIAPISISDSVKLDELKSFQLRYGDSVAIIGIMSIENGFSSANSSTIKSMYESKGINIVLTGGVYTKKTSGANQAGFMKWLTEKDDNKRYDVDAKGIWHKFFVNKEGKLYGFSLPISPLSNNVVSTIVNQGM
ncbi:MAG: hypothetical protein QM737_02630 [Ferruginibacter sp.]